MGLKSLLYVNKKTSQRFAPCMGLKRAEAGSITPLRLFAPCMGLKNSLFNRVS